ncbi:MAG: hypothetical protein AB1589_20440 [Cyanobacteriota bacterium]
MTLMTKILPSNWVTHLRHFLTTPIDKTSNPQIIFWFSLSLTYTATFGLVGLRRAFRNPYIVQDDAQQHVFWMRRFLDPELFPNDLIADYFQSVAPPGYKALYQLAAVIGIDPLVFNKWLPLTLGLITTSYCFWLCLQLLPVPATGFISALLLNQSLWLKDDLISGTARAFMYPLFLAFLYYLLRRSLLPCLVALALQGLFYPSAMVISAGILVVRMVRWESGQLRFSSDRQDYLFCATGLGVTLLVLLPLVLQSSPFGPTATVAQARIMPEFADEGRSRFFLHSPFEFWLYADRSGFFPYEWSRLPFFYFPVLLLSLGLLLPYQLRHPSRFPLVRQITSNINVLAQIALVSFGLYIAAHALLFKLYLPSRYTQYSIRILTAIAGGIAVIVLLDAIFRWAGDRTHSQHPKRQLRALIVAALLGIALVCYPVLLKVTAVSLPSSYYYKVGQEPELYKFFLQQPKDTLIASLIPQTDELPTFAKRSVLVSREHALPYHQGYYKQIRQRVMDLMDAQYSPDLKQVQHFIQNYGVDFWIVERSYLAADQSQNSLPKPPPPELNDRWLKQFPVTAEVQRRWEQGIIPALPSVAQHCSVFETQDLVVLKASCILKASGK